MEKRLRYSFRRAARAMAITSSTTAVAFFANGLSSIQHIQVFGIFAGIIVPLNYFLVIMVFPPAVVWYEENIIAKVTDDCGNPVMDEMGNEQYKRPMCICWGRFKKKKEIELDEDGKPLAKLSRTERFFDEKINWFVGHPIIRLSIIAFSLLIYGFAIWGTS